MSFDWAASGLLLHGYAVSNYFNTVRAALLEKEALFDIVRERASRDDRFLARSPMGKIPFLETSQGFLSETIPILEYLEEVEGGAALYPRSTFERARTRQAMNVIQLYLEAPLRRLYPGVFAAGVHSDEAVRAVAQQLDITIEALQRLFRLEPYLLGSALSYADLLLLYSVDLGDRVTCHTFGWSLIERLGLNEWARLMNQHSSTQVVSAEFLVELDRYLVDKDAPYRLMDGGGIFQRRAASAAAA